MTQNKLLLHELPVLDTDFFYGWFKNRNNPDFLRLIPEGTRALTLRVERENLSDEEIEASFRKVAPNLIRGLVEPGFSMLFWIWAPMEERGMPCILSHVDSDLSDTQFKLFEVRPERGSRFGAWISTRWNERWLAELMRDNKVIFDTGVSVYCALVSEEHAQRFFEMEGPVQASDFATLIRQVEIAMVFHHHMEGMFLISLNRRVQDLVRSIKNSMPKSVTLIV